MSQRIVLFELNAVGMLCICVIIAVNKSNDFLKYFSIDYIYEQLRQ